MLTCSKCKTEKDESCFSFLNKDLCIYKSQCRTCVAKVNLARYHEKAATQRDFKEVYLLKVKKKYENYKKSLTLKEKLDFFNNYLKKKCNCSLCGIILDDDIYLLSRKEKGKDKEVKITCRSCHSTFKYDLKKAYK